VQTEAEETSVARASLPVEAGESEYSVSETTEPRPSGSGPDDRLLTRAAPSGHSGGAHGAG